MGAAPGYYKVDGEDFVSQKFYHDTANDVVLLVFFLLYCHGESTEHAP